MTKIQRSWNTAPLICNLSESILGNFANSMILIGRMNETTMIVLVVLCQSPAAQSIPYGYNAEAGHDFDVGNDTHL